MRLGVTTHIGMIFIVVHPKHFLFYGRKSKGTWNKKQNLVKPFVMTKLLIYVKINTNVAVRHYIIMQ